MTETIWNYE